MGKFLDCDVIDYPRILGLTACLVNGKIKILDINIEIEALKATLRATCETSNDKCVEEFSPNPHKEIKLYSRDQDELKAVVAPWNNILEDCNEMHRAPNKNLRKFVKSIAKDCEEMICDLGASATECITEYLIDSVGR
jgi:hypothetical protein